MSSSLQTRPESQLADRYEALFRVSQAIGAHRSPKKLFEALTNELRDVIQFDGIAVAQYDESANSVHWHVSHGCSDSGNHPQPECSSEETIPCWVYQHQEPLVIPYVNEESRFPGMMKQLRECGIQSACALPLTTVHRRIGALLIGSRFPDAYSDDEVSFLSLVANQLALAIDDVLAQEQLQRERDRLKLLLDVNNSVVSNLELREVLRAIVASVRPVMQCDGVGVMLPDPDGNQLRMYALDFPNSKGFIQEEILLPIDGSVSGRVFLTGKAFVGVRPDPNETIPEAYRMLIGEEIKSCCFLPLTSRNRVLGILALAKLQENAFDQNDIDFLTQVANQVAIAVENALTYGQISDLKDRLAQEKLYLEDEIRSEMNFAEIVGVSTVLRRVLQQVETVAATDSIVLITGETGTGKELIARAIHDHSRRKDRAFVKLNCAAIPTGLLESELFGHEKGAFTGAIAQRIGRFELANQGTVFLDEIGEIPLEMQPKLLRVLQEQEFERLGSSRTIRTDARLIAATNRDLSAMVAEQKFRADLFYRLNVFPVHLPALRERPEDIPLLVRHFAEQFARRMNKVMDTIPSETTEKLVAYHWPGNIRELQNIIERAVILSTGTVLKVPVSDLKLSGSGAGPKKSDTLEEAERKHILAVLQETNWLVSGPNGAATRLGIHRATLQFRMKKLGIVRPGK